MTKTKSFVIALVAAVIIFMSGCVDHNKVYATYDDTDSLVSDTVDTLVVDTLLVDTL